MKIQVKTELYSIILDMDSKNKEAFAYIEKTILEKGLEEAGQDQIFCDYLKNIHDSNIYSNFVLKEYINNLKNSFEIKTQILNHMHNQNIIHVLSKDIEETDKELNRLKDLVDIINE